MNNYRYRSCVNCNPEYQNWNEERLHCFYDSVRDLLLFWKENGPPIKGPNHVLYRMLYEPFELSTKDRVARLDKNIRRLSSTISCRQNHACGNKSLCPVCLSWWRYGIASALKKAVQVNPKIRLVSRQETFLMPRGVYKPFDGSDELRLLINQRINPVKELPVGTKYSPYWIWRIIEEQDRLKFSSDPYYTSDRYMDVFYEIWRAIGDPELIENPFILDNYSKWSIEEQEKYRQTRFNFIQYRKNSIKAGVSDLNQNSLLTELMSRKSRLNYLERDCMGSVHRITLFPSRLNISTLLLRLDSLFLDTQEHYNYIRNNYEELESQKKFQPIKWPYKPYETVWHPRHKIVTTCRAIPKNMKDILKIVEMRFPSVCNVYSRLLPEEFLLFLNCFLETSFTVKSGFFREE